LVECKSPPPTTRLPGLQLDSSVFVLPNQPRPAPAPWRAATQPNSCYAEAYRVWQGGQHRK